MPPNFRPMTFKPAEFTEYYAPDGQKFRFDNHYRFMISEEGYGMPSIDYISQKAPLQHGETMYDYRLQPRIIQVVMRENACNRKEYWAARANLLNFIRPNRQYLNQFELGVLRKIFPDGSKRDIRALIQEGPMFPAVSDKWDAHGFTETLRFICPDPTFYDPTLHEDSIASSTSGHLVFPFTFDTIDMIFTDAFASGMNIIINYTGTWMSYPVIILKGALDGLVITNNATGETIDLSTYPIVAGETVTIDLSFGFKTVTSDINGNIIGYVGPTSDLATFAIVPEPTAPGGVNTISVTATTVSPGANLIVQYYTRYIAI